MFIESLIKTLKSFEILWSFHAKQLSRQDVTATGYSKLDGFCNIDKGIANHRIFFSHKDWFIAPDRHIPCRDAARNPDFFISSVYCLVIDDHDTALSFPNQP